MDFAEHWVRRLSNIASRRLWIILAYDNSKVGTEYAGDKPIEIPEPGKGRRTWTELSDVRWFVPAFSKNRLVHVRHLSSNVLSGTDTDSELEQVVNRYNTQRAARDKLQTVVKSNQLRIANRKVKTGSHREALQVLDFNSIGMSATPLAAAQEFLQRCDVDPAQDFEASAPNDAPGVEEPWPDEGLSTGSEPDSVDSNDS